MADLKENTPRLRGWSFQACSLAMGIVLIAVSLSAVPARANGFRLYTHGAAAAGQGNAFVAEADDPSALYYNPAGITQIPRLEFAAAMVLKGGNTSFSSPSGAMASGSLGSPFVVPPPSNFYVTVRLKDFGATGWLQGFSLGLAANNPFGVAQHWLLSSTLATAASAATLPLIDIKPTIAYRLNKYLSFGLAADIYTLASFWGDGQAELHFTSSGQPGLPPAGTATEINGSGTSGGFNVSMLYTALHNKDEKPLVNFGIIYRSQSVLPLNGGLLGNGTVLSNVHTSLVIPQIFTAGIAIWPVRDHEHEWKFEVDVDYTDWSSFKNLDLSLSNGTTIHVPQNWRGAYTALVGTQYKWLKPAILPEWEIALRAGYWYAQTPIPDATFSPALPDANQHVITTGLGLSCKGKGRLLGYIPCGSSRDAVLGIKEIGFAIAYQAMLYDTRTVHGSTTPFAPPGTADGTYQSTFHLGFIMLNARF